MPLTVSTKNPNYFADSSGNAILLTGSHTWSNLQDEGKTFPPKPFDYTGYVNWMDGKDYNFMRLWNIAEQPFGNAGLPLPWYNDPVPYARTGPGLAADGKPKFDLNKFNQEYFDRLRERVIEAGQHGIYTDVMLFQGWSLGPVTGGTNPWTYHPFNKNNNINGINGDPSNTGSGFGIQTTGEPAAVLAAQQAYVRKVIDTVNDLDNVLYEISNESKANSVQWQNNMVDYIKSYEAGKPKQHPVGMTWAAGVSNSTFLSSHADWVSLRDGYFTNPPANTGTKVNITDTDHLWGAGGNISWVWESFTRGLNPIFMDDLGQTGVNRGDAVSTAFNPAWYSVRLGMTEVAEYAKKIDLDSAKPSGSLTSTGYMLADPGDQYIAYSPGGGTFTVNLSAGAGENFSVEWLNVNTGAKVAGTAVEGGSTKSFTTPFSGPSALLLDDIAVSPPPPPPPNATYYLSTSGSDNNDGLSAATAWKTLAKASSVTFKPGDSLLLNRGNTFVGSLDPKGSGTASSVITLSSYGSGADPIISAGSNEHAIKLFNQEYWDISHIETTGATTYGVFVSANIESRDLKGISIHDMKVHDVWTTGTPSNVGGLVVVLPNGNNTTFSDVKIDNVSAYNTNQWLGIQVGFNPSDYLNNDARVSNNIQVLNSDVANVGGNLLSVMQSDNVLIQNNVAHDGGTVSAELLGVPTPNAIWTWKSSNVLVDNNEAYNMHTNGYDGGGFDIDWGSKNVTVQNNYAHDNDGYGVSVFSLGGLTTSNSVVRGNVFFNNDLKPGFSEGEVVVWGDSRFNGVQIENNTITQSPGSNSWTIDLDTSDLDPSGSYTFKGNKVTSTGNFLYEEAGVFNIDNNTYSKIGSNSPAWMYKNIYYSNFGSYVTASGQDQHSTFNGTSPPQPPPPPPPPSDTDVTPTNTTIGTGPDTLVLNISQDHYKGAAQYTVKVDGVQVNGVLTAHALKANDIEDMVTVKGDWVPGNHKVSVTLTNDAWDGTYWWTDPNASGTGHDRNVYVEEATYNGVAVPNSFLYANDPYPKSFSFTEPPPPPPPDPVIDTSNGGLWTYAKNNLGEIDKMDLTIITTGVKADIYMNLDPDGSGPLMAQDYKTTMDNIGNADLNFVGTYLISEGVGLAGIQNSSSSIMMSFARNDQTVAMNILDKSLGL